LPSKNRKKSSRIWLPERLIISTKFISGTLGEQSRAV
jgi:hypothetical protein